ncbi:MAG: DUF4336 domain-containing protein [Proteobacteria bacterium]|nr:DUF4336 domain-containing protein [Pseudomonadota bacterium]NOG58979.1 DUF4336 domain-containing protein [Pseudomonadota bacterium]
MLKEFGPSLYLADGPTVSFFGFPYPTRMAVVRLSNDTVWVWSPIRLTEELASAVEEIGKVHYIVSPNKLHHLFLSEWVERWPDARLYAPPGLARRKPSLHFYAELNDKPEGEWSQDIDQVIFHGSFAMEEVVFFHRLSKTVVICDLIQRHSILAMSGWKGMLMRLDGLVGEHGSTPREWRASFLKRGSARAARDKLLEWKPERMLIAHGECAQTEASSIIENALSWI